MVKVTTLKSICMTARRFPRMMVMLGVVQSPSSSSITASRQSLRFPPENTIMDSLKDTNTSNEYQGKTEVNSSNKKKNTFNIADINE